MFEDNSKIINGINAHVFTINSDYSLKFCNSSVPLISGRHPDELFNKKCYEAIFGLNAPCRSCPLSKGAFSGSVSFDQDVVSHTGERKVFSASLSRIDEHHYAEVLTDISNLAKEHSQLVHKFKRTRASNVVLTNDKSMLERHNKFLEKAIDSMSQGIMIVAPDYTIMNINKTLKELSIAGRSDFNNIKCYEIYGFDKPCKDCPQNDHRLEKSLRMMRDKHMTVMYSFFDKYVVESLRDTTREIKLIDEIRENQLEIREKQRQMTILNTDLLRMNEKLKGAQAVIDDELKQVGQIQESLLPEGLPAIDGYDFGACYIPAEHAGGDYYDCIEMSNNYWGFLVADVSGHGTPAAVIMAITRAIMRSYTFDVVSSSEALAMVNDILCDNIHTKDFVTMFYMVMDPSRGQMNLASAGHNPALLFDSSEFLVKKVKAGGMFLGTFQGLDYEEKKMTLDKGDIFFMYTDGLVEAMNGSREQYGYDRLMSKLMMFSSYSCERIIDEIMTDVRDFTKGSNFEDDITILAIKKL
ncbi:MAG: PP2C family protein-serine/threonine phosphatase [Deferribacterales bacterium]|nr:PP2C family protein-serine/threonine phosphatase [Deferribacterales bacterium]